MKHHREGILMKNKSREKLKKFTNLQRQERQERRIEPMNEEEYKYIKELLGKVSNENISTVTRGRL